MNTKNTIITNTSFGVHEWNKIWSYTEKIKYRQYFRGKL